MKTVYIRIYTSVLYTSYTKPGNWSAVDRSAWSVSCSNVYADDDAKYGAHLAIDGEINTTWFTWGVANAGECWWNTVLDRPVTLTGFSVTKQKMCIRDRLTSITLFLLNFINTIHAKKHRRLSSPMPLAPLSTCLLYTS